MTIEEWLQKELTRLEAEVTRMDKDFSDLEKRRADIEAELAKLDTHLKPVQGPLSAKTVPMAPFEEPNPSSPVRATELEWFKWFYQNADFGPADGDVQEGMKARFKRESGKLLPEGYNFNQSGERED